MLVDTSPDLRAQALRHDLDRVAAIVSKAQNQRIIAAGGVRNEDDLRALEAAGTHGVLIASALHAGAIAFD